jgi:DNA-binding MarR family transcriptional regulator
MDELSDAEYRALAEFRYRLRRFLHFSERAARAAGVEPQQHQLLLAVKAHGAGQGSGPPGRLPAADAAGGVTVGDLAERLQLRPHSALELVERLVARRLLRRRRSPLDRRRVLVGLTAAGDDVLRRLSLHHREELRSAGPALVQALQDVIPPQPPDAAGDGRGATVAKERRGDD